MQSTRDMRQRAELRAYFAAAFAVAWVGILLVMTSTGPRVAPDAYRGSAYLVFIAMLAGPTLASIGLTALFDGAHGLRELASRLVRWRIDRRWYATLLIAPALVAAVLGALALGSASFAPAILSSSSRGTILATAAIVGLGAGLFEELGWTGFATPRLLGRHGWLRAGILLGLVWATWHGLADYWGGAALGSLWFAHFLEWVVALVAFRALMTWIYAHTQSLFLAVLLHASFAGSQSLLWPAAATPRDELLWYGLFAAALWLIVAVVARPRCAATRAERRRPMPGDALVPEPMLVVTHAMTIAAPPERVWPWLSQMGADRAGWYSYDRIDNGGRRSASRIIPELKDIAPGDVLPALPGAKEAFVVASVEPPRDLVLTVPGRGGGGVIVSWEHLLEQLDRGRTRLIVRGRVSPQWGRMAQQAATPDRGPIVIERVYHVLGGLPRWLLIAIAGPGHRAMEAHHLRGIKRRAEAG